MRKRRARNGAWRNAEACTVTADEGRKRMEADSQGAGSTAWRCVTWRKTRHTAMRGRAGRPALAARSRAQWVKTQASCVVQAAFRLQQMLPGWLSQPP